MPQLICRPGCFRAVDGAYEKIARSIAAHERSAEVNPFSSKFDNFWRKAQAAVVFDPKTKIYRFALGFVDKSPSK
jgi:cytochrome c peroxidase